MSSLEGLSAEPPLTCTKTNLEQVAALEHGGLGVVVLANEQEVHDAAGLCAMRAGEGHDLPAPGGRDLRAESLRPPVSIEMRHLVIVVAHRAVRAAFCTADSGMEVRVPKSWSIGERIMA